jgi:hypothetical protein
MKIEIVDGINVFFGLGGVGKSYVITHKAKNILLDKKNKRKVISNYPIIFRRPLTLRQKIANWILDKKKLDTYIIPYINKTINRTIPDIVQSLVWEDTYTQEAVKDSYILIDESHNRYTGVYAHELTKQDRSFFTKLRHNNNAVCLMGQSYDDIHPFLLKKVTRLHEVKKRKWFFKKNPSCFFIDTYLSVKDYLHKDEYKIHKKTKKTRFSHERINFTQLVATAYNTHFFKDMREEPIYQTWYDKIYPSTIKEMPIREITKELPKISHQDMKDIVSSLIQLYGWKQKDASKVVNNYVKLHKNIDNLEDLLKGILKDENEKKKG